MFERVTFWPTPQRVNESMAQLCENDIDNFIKRNNICEQVWILIEYCILQNPYYVNK